MKKFIILTILLTLLFIPYVSSETVQKVPQAINGILDLSSWDFDKQGAVKLEGEWKFFWGRG